jgi:hypothetical protein
VPGGGGFASSNSSHEITDAVEEGPQIFPDPRERVAAR